ncbi:hypothetical protein [Tellurirhabdus bombi]|uniref:hypothetical protein n=1 Tax=Tellurirhabdus bombi TaxID=2907205 RepID=UPI001F16EF5A|nr:hypothetical protein [Tellurirhabdus bombi]
MFNFDPFSQGVAITEILLLLAFAALVGYLIAHLLLSRKATDLQEQLEEQETALNTCLEYKQKMATFSAIVQDDDHAVLQRIAARSSELNFDRIGRASVLEADDLKDISGIGPFFEKKLHSLNIYTFRQLANCTAEDIQKINEITEFFPGRIEREDWVGQARALHEKKYMKAL